MVKRTDIFHGTIEETLPSLKDNAYDLVFTMAVLQHIHPDSQFIFSHMVRTTKKYLITIEDEREPHWRQFPRNYRQIFEAMGMRQFEAIQCSAIDGLGKEFWARVFLKH